MVRLGAVLGALLLLAPLPEAARAASPPLMPSLSTVVERVLPAVVNVSVVMRESSFDEDDTIGVPDDDGEPALLPPEDGGGGGHKDVRHNVTALGSGFIIDPEGFIVTNSHLVENAVRITIITHDHQRHAARIVGLDTDSDIAVLRIEATAPLPYVRWADSDGAKIGDWVVAVGNPFGLDDTVTAGIVSARGRAIDDGPYDDFLQIDAPINRGNSGGPTFNLDGRVLGINTAIFSPSGGSIGIAFAIPASYASRVVYELMTHGTAEHGWLGATLQSVTPAIARSFGIDPANPAGALIDDVQHGGPAAAAGLRQGDVVLAVDGRPVQKAHDLRRLVDLAAIGSQVTLTVRRDRRDRRIAATVAAAPQPAGEAAAIAATAGEGSSEPPDQGALGLDLDALTPGLRHELGLPGALDGVLVVGVSSGSPAATLGLLPGDVIESVSRATVATPDQVAERLHQAIDSGQVLVLVNRNGNSHFLGAMRDGDGLVTEP